MKNIIKIATVFISALAIASLFSCKDKKSENNSAGAEEPETITTGHAVIVADKTVQPVIEDVLAVFQSIYPRAHIDQINREENQIVDEMLKDSAKIVILPRELTDEEQHHFEKINIIPQVTAFASDAVAFIANGKSNDTLINLEEVMKVLRGEPSESIKRLVLDNPNSSVSLYMLKQAGIEKLPASGVFSLKDDAAVIKYVHDNEGAIGVIGVNWLLQPPPVLKKDVDGIHVLAVNNVKIKGGTEKYYKPSQSNIATGVYPIIRKLYVLNFQGTNGLGMGFASYIRAREGQRIILKSGLLPVEIPYREISIRKEL